jgi:hypothetical protein
MAHTHQAGWTAPSGRELKSSCAMIDEDLLQLFKRVVFENAQYYENRYVARIGKALAEELEAEKRLQSLDRYEERKRPWKFYGKPQRKFCQARKGAS